MQGHGLPQVLPQGISASLSHEILPCTERSESSSDALLGQAEPGDSSQAPHGLGLPTLVLTWIVNHIWPFICPCGLVSVCLLILGHLHHLPTDTPSPLSDSKSGHTLSPPGVGSMHRQRSSTLGSERSKENQHSNRSLHDDRDWVARETGIAEHRDNSVHFLCSCFKMIPLHINDRN